LLEKHRKPSIPLTTPYTLKFLILKRSMMRFEPSMPTSNKKRLSTSPLATGEVAQAPTSWMNAPGKPGSKVRGFPLPHPCEIQISRGSYIHTSCWIQTGRWLFKFWCIHTGCRFHFM